jgi:hypothetical protein
MACRGHAFTGQHLPDRQPEDFQVYQDGPVVDVPNVEAELLFPADRIPSVHLCPAGDTGLHFVSAHLLGGVERQILGQQRARADEAHVAFEYIHQRWQLIDAGGAQESAEPGHAHRVGGERVFPRTRVTHGLELVQRERLAVQTDSGLSENASHWRDMLRVPMKLP